MEQQKTIAINYIEFSCRELASVKQFYTEAFGWSFTDWGADYAAFEDGVLSGGFHRHDAGGNGKNPLVILHATDLEAAYEKVTAAGGEIVQQIFSFPGGRRFHFNDPAGNELAVWGA